MSEETNQPEKNNEPENVVADYFEGYQQLELQSAESNIKKARNALFVVAALTLVANLIQLSMTDELNSVSLIIVLLLTGIFAGLGLLTKKHPFTAIVIGLIVYVGLWVFDIIILGPEYLVKGILVKGIIVYFLITGLKHAREAERLKKELTKN